jgi:hypothetical protein
VQPPPAFCPLGIDFPRFASRSGSTVQSVVGHVFHGAEIRWSHARGTRPANQQTNVRVPRRQGPKARRRGVVPAGGLGLATEIVSFAD